MGKVRPFDSLYLAINLGGVCIHTKLVKNRSVQLDGHLFMEAIWTTFGVICFCSHLLLSE